MRITATWVMVIWPAAFAATALYFDRQLRDGGRFARSFTFWVFPAIALGIVVVLSVFSYYVLGTKALLGKSDPIGDEAGYEELANNVVAAMAQVGATWIVTTDYRTQAMLRWRLKESVPVIQLNERSRYLGWREPDLTKVVGHPAIYVAPIGKMDERVWDATAATREPIKTIDRVWRGVVFESYVAQKVTGLTPELAPPVGSPLYRWPLLADDAAGRKFATAALP
jgi:hypothetical protein